MLLQISCDKGKLAEGSDRAESHFHSENPYSRNFRFVNLNYILIKLMYANQASSLRDFVRGRRGHYEMC